MPPVARPLLCFAGGPHSWPDPHILLTLPGTEDSDGAELPNSTVHNKNINTNTRNILYLFIVSHALLSLDASPREKPQQKSLPLPLQTPPSLPVQALPLYQCLFHSCTLIFLLFRSLTQMHFFHKSLFNVFIALSPVLSLRMPPSGSSFPWHVLLTGVCCAMYYVNICHPHIKNSWQIAFLRPPFIPPLHKFYK